MGGAALQDVAPRGVGPHEGDRPDVRVVQDAVDGRRRAVHCEVSMHVDRSACPLRAPVEVPHAGRHKQCSVRRSCNGELVAQDLIHQFVLRGTHVVLPAGGRRLDSEEQGRLGRLKVPEKYNLPEIQNSNRQANFAETDPPTLSTPWGRPASCARRASITAAPGSCSDGFSTKVLPAVTAGGHIHSGTIAGKLNGQMPATTCGN